MRSRSSSFFVELFHSSSREFRTAWVVFDNRVVVMRYVSRDDGDKYVGVYGYFHQVDSGSYGQPSDSWSCSAPRAVLGSINQSFWLKEETAKFVFTLLNFMMSSTTIIYCPIRLIGICMISVGVSWNLTLLTSKNTCAAHILCHFYGEHYKILLLSVGILWTWFLETCSLDGLTFRVHEYLTAHMSKLITDADLHFHAVVLGLP